MEDKLTQIKSLIDEMIEEETVYDEGYDNLHDIRRYIDDKLDYWASSDVFYNSFEQESSYED